MLYLVATPLGHLDDFSYRAVKMLGTCDLILCEDTRHSITLLNHYNIVKPILSFHQLNERSREEDVISRLKEGQQIALLSDAGTPLISDPGHSLVRACIEQGVPFTALPGPCSPIQALVLSGFQSIPFQFLGFLPKDTSSLQTTLHKALCYRGTSIAFESPRRILDTLEILHRLSPQRIVAVARELTKIHEECVRGDVEKVLQHFTEHPPRGEIVLLIEEGPPPNEPLGIEECVKLLQDLHGLSLRDAIRAAAKLLDIPKRDVYRLFI